ncbi:MAG: TenA family transcriptional regulator [Dehalococcoidia bacterium]
MTFSKFVERHAEIWQQAIHHPFLDGVRDGSVPVAAFDRWLSQDYRFVRSALGPQALLLLSAPRADQALLIGGLAALESELTWFETHLRARGLDLDAPLMPANRAYGDFLAVVARGPYVCGIVATAALERAYLEAWTSARPGATAYREFVEHWTTDEFRSYVAALEQAADRALAAQPELISEAEATFLWVARYEREFWQMAFG